MVGLVIEGAEIELRASFPVQTRAPPVLAVEFDPNWFSKEQTKLDHKAKNIEGYVAFWRRVKVEAWDRLKLSISARRIAQARLVLLQQIRKRLQ